MEILEVWGRVVKCKEHAVWSQMDAVGIQALTVTNHVNSLNLSLLIYRKARGHYLLLQAREKTPLAYSVFLLSAGSGTAQVLNELFQLSTKVWLTSGFSVA